MSELGDAGQRRPLLVNGERLGSEIEAVQAGGGEKFHPRTADEARQHLLPQISVAVATAQALPDRLRAERLYVEAELLPNYLAASYYPEALFNRIDALPVGSRIATGELRTAARSAESPTRRLILAISPAGLARLNALAATGGQGTSERQAAEDFKKLESITLSTASGRELAPDGEMHPWEAVLHPRELINGSQVPLGAEAMRKWYDLVREFGGRAREDLTRVVGGLTFSPVAAPAEVLEELRRFNPLRAIRPMPQFRPFPASGPRAVPAGVVAPPSTTPSATSHRVAVFDCGLDGGPHSAFFPAPPQELTGQPVDPDGQMHGTGVAGAAMYGLLWPGDIAAPPPLPVDHFRIHPPDDPHDFNVYSVLDQIVATVAGGDFTLVNLSYGPDVCVEDDVEPDRWTSELDQLAYEKNVLFVVAAGNNGEMTAIAGADRVQAPSDMANGLAVGSCSAAPPDKPWERAPYSAVGPGRPGNQVQPAVVQFGGIETAPFPVLTASGQLLSNCGTSFAAPLVVHALSELAVSLHSEADPNSLRAIAVHFAEPHRAFRQKVAEVGHGRARLSLLGALDCEPNEVHVLYRDTIERGQVLSYKLPIPSGCTDKVAMKITCSYFSPVEPAEASEYTRASLGMTLRPNQFVYGFTDPTTSKSQPLDLRTPEAHARIAAGDKISAAPVAKLMSRLEVANEAKQREAGKWETVRSHGLGFRGEDLDGPVLELSYLARRAGALDNDPPDLSFAMVVSIRERDSTDLYDRARAEFHVLNPVTVDVSSTVTT
jgi:hypothetical protein